jgi:arylsulfatase A-like enzyme/Flp pilus assembly protein TadD
LVVVLTLPSLLESRRRGARLSAIRAGGEALNVLLVTLDTTRPDRLGCYGYADGGTPAIDEFARQGVRFENAKTHVPITLPAHASLFTGTIPVTHGAHNHFDVLADEGNETIAEILAAHGYATAGFVAAFVLDHGLGISQGFDHYGDNLGRESEVGPPRLERRAGDVVDEALAWLAEHPDERFFAFVHLYDPHLPYSPPAPYDRRYEGRPYDGEIAYMDSQFGRLTAFLDDSGLARNTLVVVVGDHGESLGEHGIEGHASFIYETVTRVPLMMRCPGLLPSRRSVPEQVRLVDVLPTVLDVLGLEPPAALDGTSLLPYVEVRGTTPDLPAYIESYNLNSTFGWSPLLGVEDGRWKYIRTPERELYDLRRDPSERDNVCASHPDVASELDQLLESLLGAEELGAREVSVVDEATREKLASLGYIGSPTPTTPGTPRREDGLTDPKHVWALYLLYQRALVAGAYGRHADAADILRELHERLPDNLSVTRLLATHCIAGGRSEEAVPHLERHLRVYPDDADAALTLGIVYGQLGRHQDAVSVLRAALKSERHAPKVRATLGSVYFSSRDLDRADRMFLQVIDDEATDRETLYASLLNLGSLCYANVRAPERAVRYFERALEMHAGSEDAHFYLAVILAGYPARARDAAEHAHAFLAHAQQSDGRRARMGALLEELAASTASP